MRPRVSYLLSPCLSHLACEMGGGERRWRNNATKVPAHRVLYPPGTGHLLRRKKKNKQPKSSGGHALPHKVRLASSPVVGPGISLPRRPDQTGPDFGLVVCDHKSQVTSLENGDRRHLCRAAGRTSGTYCSHGARGTVKCPMWELFPFLPTKLSPNFWGYSSEASTNPSRNQK